MPLSLPRPLHRWNLPVRDAIQLQTKLAPRIEILRPPGPLRWVAGLDLAFEPDGSHCLAAVVLWDRVEGRVVEQHLARRPVTFPYVPGLLTFREAPTLLAALRRLAQRPDVLLCDGQGRAHPRRLGVASHLGLVTGIPSIGCAKSRLVGTFEPPGPLPGDVSPLLDNGEVIGEVVRTKRGVHPLFVSVGHRVDQATAREVVLSCCGRHRLPEPTRRADRAVAEARAALKRAG